MAGPATPGILDVLPPNLGKGPTWGKHLSQQFTRVRRVRPRCGATRGPMRHLLADAHDVSHTQNHAPYPEVWYSAGLVAQIGCRSSFPLTQTDLSCGLCDGHTKCRVAV